MKNKISHRLLCTGGLSVGLFMVLPSWAATYYCDNDRAASQYPQCNVSYTGSWIYYNGQGRDYNGDDRRERGGNVNGSGFYSWTFNATRNYTFAVYLNNTAFTEPKALYLAVNSAGQVILTYFNQNTASGGWHTIGSLDVDNLAVAAGFSTKYVAGADGLRASFSTTSASTASMDSSASTKDAADVVDTSTRCSAIASQADPRIAAIQQKMLGASQRYRDIAGRFHVFFRNNGQNDTVDFQVSEAQRRSMVRSIDDNGDLTESDFDGSRLVMRHPADRSYRSFVFPVSDHADIQQHASSLASNESMQDPRFYRNGRCEDIFVHREDAAHAANATEVTDPENYASWLYDSPSRIVGHAVLLGRPVTVIEGHQDDYLRRKLGAATFTMWVDDATGVLLKLVGKSDAGLIAYSIEASSIAIDQGLNLPATVAEVPAGWRAVAPAMERDNQLTSP